MKDQNNELDLAVFFTGIYRFFYKNIKLFLSCLLIGVLLGGVYDLVKKPYYNTSVYATSALSYFETEEVDFRSKKIILNQQAVVDIINNLSMLVEDKELGEISQKLNIPIEIAENIRFIEAEELFYVDGENIQQKRDKFQVTLEVYDNSSILTIQKGIQYFIEHNQYIKNQYDFYLRQSKELSDRIELEINDLKEIRSQVGAKPAGDYSEIKFNSQHSQTDNQIINLFIKKQQIQKHMELLKPISFLGSFSMPEKPENRFWIRIGIMAGLFFMMAIGVALIKYFNAKMIEE